MWATWPDIWPCLCTGDAGGGMPSTTRGESCRRIALRLVGHCMGISVGLTSSGRAPALCFDFRRHRQLPGTTMGVSRAVPRIRKKRPLGQEGPTTSFQATPRWCCNVERGKHAAETGSRLVATAGWPVQRSYNRMVTQQTPVLASNAEPPAHANCKTMKLRSQPTAKTPSSCTPG